MIYYIDFLLHIIVGHFDWYSYHTKLMKAAWKKTSELNPNLTKYSLLKLPTIRWSFSFVFIVTAGVVANNSI